MRTLSEIEALARDYNDVRVELEENVRALEEAIAKAKRERLPSIRDLVARAAACKAALLGAVSESRPLFDRPKTHIFHGIRVGFAKARGKIEIPDPAAVIGLIRKHLPGRFNQLVKITEKPVKGALNLLSAADLKRIGVTVIDAGDEAIAQPTDSEIDKLVDALLDDKEEETEK